MRVALVVNPRSGRNRGASAAKQAEAQFRAAGWQVTTSFTTCPGDAERVAGEAARDGFDIVFACGGDGTVSQVISGLIGSGIPTGIIPAGTGNDLCRTLGLSTNPAVAARLLTGGRTAEIDLLAVNGASLRSVNIVGLGFDAAVAERMNRRVRLAGGVPAYLTAVLQELLTLRPTKVRLAVDGQEWQGQALLVAVANAQSYGAGMRIAPQARVDDGLLDVVLVKHMSRFEFLRSLPRVFSGKHLSHSCVSTWTGREVTIETDTPRPVLVDGDIRVHTPLYIRICPGAAKLWVHEEFTNDRMTNLDLGGI